MSFKNVLKLAVAYSALLVKELWRPDVILLSLLRSLSNAFSALTLALGSEMAAQKGLGVRYVQKRQGFLIPCFVSLLAS